MLQLKEYQQRALDALENYLRDAVTHGAQRAFVLQTGRPYYPVEQLPGLPYICLRIPTGGGKTLVACHALGVAVRRWLQSERTVCLWLVPSNTIREQTLAALRNRSNPYRQAIDAGFAGSVCVMDLSEALYTSRSVLDGETVIIVSTLAALRVEDIEGRKVYEQAGALAPLVSGIDEGLKRKLERYDNGDVIPSLANALKLRRPIIIMDEAHNARTPLSFDTLARFDPSCIIEMTATPETTHNPTKGHVASNVLHHVSAAELKASEMIKLPIRLRNQVDWKQSLAEAVAMQQQLEETAREEEEMTGEYIRPVVLVQAQAKNRPLTVEVVKESLIEDFKIPEEQIAIATGETRQLENVDLFDRATPIRYVITVQALKEGWDCSFAYILCTVSEIATPRSVEQILGRILRMPRARRKQREELNCAYAFSSSSRFIDTLRNLREALVENGFERLEASDLVRPAVQESFWTEGTLFAQWAQPVTEVPDLSRLEPSLRSRLHYDEVTGNLNVSQTLSERDKEAIQECFTREENKKVVERLYHRSNGRTVLNRTDEAREPFRVPLLAIRHGEQLEVFDETFFLDVPWNLSECDVSLGESKFPTTGKIAEEGTIDIDTQGRAEIQFAATLHGQLAMLDAERGWSETSLANWLDRHIPHPDIPRAQSTLFILRTITELMRSRKLTIDQLAHKKFQLRNGIEAKIGEHRRAQAQQSYKMMLFADDGAGIEVDPECSIIFEQGTYAPSEYYSGSFKFRKHYFDMIGNLKADGEEFACATYLDSHPNVKRWVRNLDSRPNTSFWLPTSRYRFYPDFIAELIDGRILVVEYKGAHLWSAEEATEKRNVGMLWAERSNGRCLFVMPKGNDMGAIDAVIERSNVKTTTVQ